MTSWGSRAGAEMGDAVWGPGLGDATTTTFVMAEWRIITRGMHRSAVAPWQGGGQQGGEPGAWRRQEAETAGGGPASHCSRAAAGKCDARPGETQAEKETGLGARACCCRGVGLGSPA